MSRTSLVLEIFDRELRVYRFSPPLLGIPKKLRKLVKCDLIPIPEGVIEQGILRQEMFFSETINRYLASHNIRKSTSVSVIIPVEQAVIRHFALPWIPKNKRKSAVRFLVEEEIPVPNTDLSYDFIILNENKKGNSLHILVGALRESIVRKYCMALAETGVRVDQVGFALCGYAKALSLESTKDKLLLQARENSLQMILFRGQIPELIRILPLNITIENPEQEWIREIQRVLLYYRNQHPDLKIAEILLNGKLIVDEVGRELIDAGLAPFAERVKISVIPPGWNKEFNVLEDQGLGGLSYALQVFTKLPGFALWREKRLNFPKTALLSPIMATLILIAGLIYWMPLHKIERQLQIDVSELERKAMPFENTLETNKKLETAWNKAKNPAVNVGEILARIQNIPDCGLDIKKLEYKQGIIYLEGIAEKAQLVEGMIENLHKLGWKKVNLTSYRQDEADAVEFNLTAADYDS